MKRHIQIGELNFEIERVKVRRTERYGDPFDAVVDIIFVNGEAHIKSLLKTDGSQAIKSKSLVKFLLMLGYDEYHVESYTDGKCVKRIVKLNERKNKDE
jgi:hypothetical protein